MNTYVSQHPDWDPGAIKGSAVILSAGTGAGKTTAVLGLTQNTEFMSGGRMLYLTTRRSDRKKLNVRTDGNDAVVVRTVQGLEAEAEDRGIDLVRYLDTFSVVVVDEAHFWTTDSSFAAAALSYEAVKSYADGIEAGSGNTLILITATPEGLEDIFTASEIRIPPTATHIRGAVFVPAIDYTAHAAARILRAKERGEKGIVFCREKADAARIQGILDANGAGDCVDFYAARGRELQPDDAGDFHVKKTAILSTSVLAFGIDFWDEKIAFVMTNEADPLLAVQELGRKRCTPGEKIEVIIADYTATELHEIYGAYAEQIADADLYMNDRAAYMKPICDGGRWRVRSIENNPCIYIDRTGTQKENTPYRAFCNRMSGYDADIRAGADTWRGLILSRLGIQPDAGAPVFEASEVIENEVRAVLKDLAANPAPTVSDWARVGVALRLLGNSVQAKNGKTYRYGSFLSRPSALSKHIERYGYRAGKPIKKRVDGKVVQLYPVEEI